MFQASFDKELFQQMINEAVDKALEAHEIKETLPPVLTRKEFMETFKIGESKCAELFNREDFPVNREFGHPRVPTKQLLEWIHANTDWNLKDAKRSKSPFHAV